MLSMAFAPDYERSRRYFVYYVDNGGAIVVDQFRRRRGRPNRTQPGSGRPVIRDRRTRASTTRAARWPFGPDGLLYLGPGDGGGGGDPDRNAQNLGRLLGKILRIGPEPDGGYSVPRVEPVRRDAPAPAARCSPTACATPTASRSTAAPAP